ncbi:MAG: oligosaccharide flippase family protein, partial [Bacteroidetes bacterium]|nr:oligosaccharide flippase family protein [Bacteroidota bacterium]MBU1797361.1 oligosaccharide flippase family protein [Bacteroidota bacterium]
MPLSQVLKIRNNSIIIFFAQIISLFLNIISISLAARYLGVDVFGKFNYLLAIIGISAKIFDFGFNPIIFRELSQKSNNGKYLGSVFIFRTIIVLLVVCLFSFIGYLSNLSALQISLIAILSFNILLSNKFTNIRELVTIPFKVDLKMYIPMYMIMLDNVLFLSFVLLMPLFEGGIYYFGIIYTLSNLPGMVILSFVLLKQYDFEFKFKLDEIKYLFKESLPLMGYIIFAVVYVQIDVLLLEYFSGSSSVGIYSSVLRLIIPLKLIPNITVITLFSLIVKNIGHNNQNEQIVKFVTKLFFLFSVAFSAFMFAGAKDIVLLVFGSKYEEAYLPLQILSLSIFFDIFSFFILDLFTAYKNQKYNFYYVIIVTFVILFSNILLIPSYNYVGASVSRFISAFIGYIFLVYILNKK